MESRRRKRLTPLSGELRASEDWAAATPEPVEEPKRRRRKRQPPTTWPEALARGLVRFAAVVAAAAAAIVLVALLFVWLKNADPQTAFPRAFYFGGAIFTVVAVLGGAGRGRIGPQSRSEHEIAVNRSLVYAAIGSP